MSDSNQASVPMKKRVRPLYSLVVVRPDPKSEKTTTGIWLPDAVVESGYGGPRMIEVKRTGTVLATGDGAFSPYTGNRVENDVKVGDQVIYQEARASMITVNNEELHILEVTHILGVVEDTDEPADPPCNMVRIQEPVADLKVVG